MTQTIEVVGYFLSKTDAVKTADEKFLTIAKFLIDDREQSYTVITDGDWLNPPDLDKKLKFSGEFLINETDKTFAIMNPRWRYFSKK